MKKPKGERPRPVKSYALRSLQFVTDLVARLIDRFGWPGAFLILSYIFVERHGTELQKQAIIDRFILGKGLQNDYSEIVIAAVGLLIVGATHYYHGKREAVLQKEIDRLAEWKSAQQQARIGVGLHHTETKREG